MTDLSVQDSFKLSELDLALVNALQVNPRASWAQLAGVLDVDASTLNRRWTRLERNGAAWVACQPLSTADPAMAFVEMSVEPGRSLEVAAALAECPQAMTIDVTAGQRDLLLTVVCRDSDQLAGLLLDRLARVPHAVRVQSHILVRAYTEASRWRLRSLSRRQERQLAGTLPGPPEDPRARLTGPRDRALATALSVDGRLPCHTLAQAAGTSESTARRRLNALLGAGVVRLRCELARGLTGWPVSEWFFVRVPSDRIDEAAASLATVPEVRAVLSAAGPFNLIVAVWMRTVADGQRLETQLTRRLPHVQVADRSVVIRPYKLAGRLLDPRGFAAGVIPLDFETPA